MRRRAVEAEKNSRTLEERCRHLQDAMEMMVAESAAKEARASAMLEDISELRSKIAEVESELRMSKSEAEAAKLGSVGLALGACRR